MDADGAYNSGWSMYSLPTNFKYETQIQNFSPLSDQMHYSMPHREVARFKDEQVCEAGRSFDLNVVR